MPTVAVLADTPYYVLMNGKKRLGPEVVPFSSGTECVAIYGFSDKNHLDKFRANSRLPLLPYPLTRSYLRDQTDLPRDGLNLVVIDVAGPGESWLHAATMEAVLQGQQDRTAHVTAAYDLTFEPDVAAYRITVNRNLKTRKGR